MPVTVAPICAMGSESNPPPHPRSNMRNPLKGWVSSLLH
ncbi:hypothetical protein FXW24_03700 [Candidatus Liberibacter asiaticus]|nr:hypothetical protein FXW24_03700 [Candidatus Liberibacter asiaticus]